MNWFSFVFCVILLSFIFSIIKSAINEKEEYKLKKKEEKQVFALNREHHLPKLPKYTYLSGLPEFPNKIELYVRKTKTHLIFRSEAGIKVSIPINKIYFYSAKEDLMQKTEFTGGSIQDTISTTITEGIFGTAAAITAAIKRSQHIITKDKSRTIIKANISEKDCFILFEKSDLYYYLLDEIPEKEQSFVAMQNKL